MARRTRVTFGIGKKVSFFARHNQEIQKKIKTKEKNRKAVHIFARLFICILLIVLMFMIGFRVGQFVGYRTAVIDMSGFVTTLLDGNHAEINIQLNETKMVQEAYKLVQQQINKNKGCTMYDITGTTCLEWN